MTSSTLPSSILPVPDRITSNLPISHWDVYLHILTTQLRRELPDSDETEQINMALAYLQIIACGDAALDSLAEFRKDLRGRGRKGRGKTACKRVKAVVKRCVKGVFDF